MYSTVMVPVDLAHIEALEKALATSADLAKHYDAEVIYVGVTSSEPNEVAHSPEEYARKLEAFAAKQGEARGIRARAKTVHCNDPGSDLHAVLRDTASDLGVDLVVMGTHIPGSAEHIFASHGGYVAAHAKTSVMLVR